MMKLLTVSVLVLLLFAAFQCEEGGGITYVNQTDQPVDIYLGDSLDDFSVSIPENLELDVGTLRTVWEDVIVGRDAAGSILFREEMTWDELKERDFRYVITPEMIAD